ncbi:GPP34 family phosphoprotein [Streptomyces sp. NPDC002463]|uniref:GPP34 family phosphoprotein n=1 Tax=Streptomyces sp. NPDC002463 TaxID=3364645 RepID=UPI003675CAC5
MTTARDLALFVLDLPPERAVEPGDLSLALAGAEAVDLLKGGSLALDGDRMAPRSDRATGDRLLDQALASVVRQQSWQTIQSWLWRRGKDLAETYARDLERTGRLGRPRRHGPWLGAVRPLKADSAERSRARLLTSGDPVLVALTALLGIGDFEPGTVGDVDGDASVATVLAAVGDAVTELEAVRLRRGVEAEAFDNMWRA